MHDFPINVWFTEHPDAWTLDQRAEQFMSVQGGINGEGLWFEMWGESPVISPAGQRYEAERFQHNVWINPKTSAWRARRTYPDVMEGSGFDPKHGAVEFTRDGGESQIIAAHKI